MQETWVRSLCQENPLEMGMDIHSIILTERIPWTEEPGGLHGDTTELLTLYQTHLKRLRTQQYGAYILGREDGQ